MFLHQSGIRFRLVFTVLQVYSLLATKRYSFSVSFHGVTGSQCTCIKNGMRFGWCDSSMGAHALKHKSPLCYAHLKVSLGCGR